MIEGIDTAQRIEFSCKDDKEPKTIFILRPVSGIESLTLLKPENMLMAAVMEIKNPDIVEDEKKKAFLFSLSTSNILEIILKINSLNKLSEDDEKN